MSKRDELMTQFNHETDRIRCEFAEQSREITSLRQQLHELQERQAKRLEEFEKMDPDAYGYQYHDGIRFDTGGREINASAPIRTLRFYRADTIRALLVRAAAAIAEEHAK